MTTYNAKTIIPHICWVCSCELWFIHLDDKNYVYKENKKGYYYICKECFKQIKGQISGDDKSG